MILKRFEICSASHSGWSRIASDDIYEVQKKVDLSFDPTSNGSFRICTITSPPLLIAISNNLEEIMLDWSQLTSGFRPQHSTLFNGRRNFGRSHQPGQALSLSFGLSCNNSISEYSMALQALSRLGGQINLLGHCGQGPLGSVWGILVFSYFYIKGLFIPAIMVWLLWCMIRYFMLMRSNPDLVISTMDNNAHNVYVASYWIGQLGNTLDSLTAILSWRRPWATRLVFLLIAGSIGLYLHLNFGLDFSVEVLASYNKIWIILAVFTICSRIIHWLLPELAQSLGLIDILGFFMGHKPLPQPRHQYPIDWSSALPNHSVGPLPLSTKESPPLASNSTSKPTPTTNAPPLPTDLKDLDAILEKADKLQSDGKAMEQRDLLTSAKSQFPDSFELLWRLGRSCSEVKELLPDKTKKVEVLREGIECCRRAIELNEKCGKAHRWFGVLSGELCDFLPTKEKVQVGMKVRDSFEKAVELEPDDPLSQHLLGQFFWAVANLSWVERKAASVMVEVPDVKIEDALAKFQRSAQLDPNDILNCLMLGKAFNAMKEKDKAKEWLKKAIEKPSVQPKEKSAQKEASDLLKKL